MNKVNEHNLRMELNAMLLELARLKERAGTPTDKWRGNYEFMAYAYELYVQEWREKHGV